MQIVFCVRLIGVSLYTCVCVSLCVHLGVCVPARFTTSCFPFSVLVSALRWLHFKLHDRSQPMQMAQWWYTYLLEAQLSLNDPPPFSSICGSSIIVTDKCGGDVLQYVFCLQLIVYFKILKNWFDLATQERSRAGFHSALLSYGLWLLTET